MISYFKKSLAVFSILGILFIPLTFFGFSFQYRVTKFIFQTPVGFIEHHLFPQAIKNIEFSSDTISLNILLGLLLVIAFLLALVIRSTRVVSLFKILSAYYIAAVFLKYGFDKVFQRQFYLPEPNILYSNFGNLTKDTLFWSTMGISPVYQLAMGVIEVITGVLILFKRTRMAGFFLALAVTVNILLINIGFDISVKLFSLFLLMVVLLNLYPVLKTTYTFLIQQPAVAVNKWVHIAVCAGIIGFIAMPYISSRTVNDTRPYLHGAYEVTQFAVNDDFLNSDVFPYKRVFIHSNSYIIFQQEDDTMVDYFFEINEEKKQLEITDYNNNKITVVYNYDEKEGVLQLLFQNKSKWTINAKALNWKVLPALQHDMHYTIDEIK